MENFMHNLEQLIKHSSNLANFTKCCYQLKNLEPICIIKYSRFYCEAFFGIIAKCENQEIFFQFKDYNLDINFELEKFNDEGFGELRKLYETIKEISARVPISYRVDLNGWKNKLGHQRILAI